MLVMAKVPIHTCLMQVKHDPIHEIFHRKQKSESSRAHRQETRQLEENKLAYAVVVAGDTVGEGVEEVDMSSQEDEQQDLEVP
jgi:hypothetical protein